MKLFIKKLFYFLIPFFLIIIFIVIVDPYNLINISHIINDKTKVKCLDRNLKVAPRGFALWNILSYRRNPTPNIILGDSKMMDIDTAYVNKFLQGKTSNLSLPGASYQTLVDFFWMATKTTHLQNVIFQTSFLSYNELDRTPLFKDATDLIKKPYNYFLERKYLEDSFFTLLYAITKNDTLVNWKLQIKEDLWSRSLKWINSILTKEDYKYPSEYFLELKEISTYCKKNNIHITFVIAPSYAGFREIIKKAGFEKEYEHFKSDINSLDNSVDLDSGLSISSKKSYFYDYLHLKPEYQDSIIKLIFESRSYKED